MYPILIRNAVFWSLQEAKSSKIVLVSLSGVSLQKFLDILSKVFQPKSVPNDNTARAV